MIIWTVFLSSIHQYNQWSPMHQPKINFFIVTLKVNIRRVRFKRAGNYLLTKSYYSAIYNITIIDLVQLIWLENTRIIWDIGR